MNTIELEKSKVHMIAEIIGYIPNAGALSFDAGEETDDKTSPFDTYIQIIDVLQKFMDDKNSSID